MNMTLALLKDKKTGWSWRRQKKLEHLVQLMYTTFWKPKRAVDSSVVFGEEAALVLVSKDG